MLAFLTENLGTIIVGLIVFAMVAQIIVKLTKEKKKGKSSCGCDCKCCPGSSSCHNQ